LGTDRENQGKSNIQFHQLMVTLHAHSVVAQWWVCTCAGASRRSHAESRGVPSTVTGPGFACRRGVSVQFMKESLTFTGEKNASAQLLLSVMGAEWSRRWLGRPGVHAIRQIGGICDCVAADAGGIRFW
jgi:hypothetical protein